MEPLISLDTTQPVEPLQPISLDTGLQGNPLVPAVANNRANKAVYGLGETITQGQQNVYQKFVAGQEPEFRRHAAQSMDTIRETASNKIIQDLVTKHGAMTPDDMRQVRSMVQNWNPADPNSVIEDAFSVKAVNSIYTVGGGLDTSDNRPYSMVEEAMRNIPSLVADSVKEGGVFSSKVDWWRTQRENLQSDLDNQSYLGWGADQAKNLLQLYREAKLRGNIGIDILGGLGTSLEEQAKALLRMPKDEMIAKGTAIVNALKKDNPSLAAEFAEAVLGQTNTVLENTFSVLAIPDIVTGGSIAKALARKTFLYNATRVAIKDTIQGLDNVGKQPVKTAVADAIGDLPEAAITKEVQALTSPVPHEVNAMAKAMEELPSVIRLDKQNISNTPGRFGQEIVNRLREGYDSFEKNLFDTIQRISKVERISPVLATEAGLRALMAEMKNAYPGLNNAILDITSIYKRDLTNTYHADMIIANPNGGYFTRPETAQAFAEYMGLKIDPAKDVVLKQQGVGYYVSITKPVNETSYVVRDYLTATAASKSPNSVFSAFAGMLRTPEETLATEQLLNRKIATYAPSELMKVAKETAQSIEKLAKWTLPFTARRERWNQWERAVKYAQEAPDPRNPGQKGWFFENPAQLEEFYWKNFQRHPQMQEIEAYFAFKRLGEMDHVLRNLQIYKNITRVGGENHQLFFQAADGNRVSSGVFQGVIRQDFPGGEGTTMLLNKTLGKERIFANGSLNTKMATELRDGIKAGTYKVIELYDPELRPFSYMSTAVKDERIRWVIVETGQHESKPIDFVNLPYRGGGHFEYDYDHYIKQARVSQESVRGEKGRFTVKNWYEGDTTVIPIAIRAMGEDVAKKMNAVRFLLLSGDKEGAKQLAGRTLPIEWDTFYGWFKPTKDATTGRINPARLSMKEPFQVVERNKSIIDKSKEFLANRYLSKDGKSNFHDGTKEGSLARQYQVQYTGERDAADIFTLRNEGTAVNPLYKIADPTLIDPIPAMNRALSRITNSMFMDDYKISAIEHWLKEAKNHLDIKEGMIQYAPFHVFSNIGPNSWVKGAPPELVKQMETRRLQIMQFTGTASNTQAMVQSLGQKLADSIYRKYGEQGLRIAGFQIEPDFLLARATDPVKFVRSLTFHAKLGLFSVPQFIVQNQTWTTIAGVAGFSKATPGAFATLLHQWSRVNPTMLDTLDRYATRLHIPGTSRWKPGEFKEAWKELQNTGFANVGNEYALIDDMMSSKVISTGKDRFLDAGTFFFKEGEKNVRLGAWYTSYREWRDLNPTLKITDKERREILNRASLLNVNMDRSSNSILQHGAFSIPSQFLTYQIRAAELFFGKRLTSVERGRLFATNAAVYGIPTATSGALLYPFGDNMRQTAIDLGYNVGENYWSTLMEGIPATALALATGGGDIRKGNFYNVGERYGSQGFTPLRDALMSDRTIWDIMTGAAGSTLANTWSAGDGFRTAMMGFFTADKKEFKMKPDDVADIFKEISSFNQAWRLWAALNTGRWMTKTEQWASDVTPLNAVFQSVMGLQNQEISDVRTMRMIKKDEQALADHAIKKFSQEMQRGFRDMKDNPEQANEYFRRAFTWLRVGGVSETNYGKAMNMATSGNENMIDRGKWGFYMKDVPSSKSYPGIPSWLAKRDNIKIERTDALQKNLMKGQQ